MHGFNHFKSACSVIQGIENMHMIKKGQANTKTVAGEIKLINQLFGIA